MDKAINVNMLKIIFIFVLFLLVMLGIRGWERRNGLARFRFPSHSTFMTGRMIPHHPDSEKFRELVVKTTV